jgi:hypothetical protein
MEIQKTKYISDTPDVELAATIKKFCDLVEMQPPSQAKEFINLLRLGFGRYPFEMLENAFHDVDVEAFGSKGDKDLQYKVDFRRFKRVYRKQ